VLRIYTSRVSYLRAMVEGASRIDLDGNTVSTVTASEAEHAAARLAARIAKRVAAEAAKQAERKAASKAAVVRPIPISQPARIASSPIIKRPVLSLPGFKKRAAQ
jgi:sRNA-binding protein